MAHVPAELQKKMEAAMPSDVVWRFRPMFGGIGVYANDKMCVSLSDVGLAVKLSGDAHAELLKRRGAKPLQYEPGAPVSKTYVVVPDAVLADRRQLGHWLALAAAQAGSKSPDSGKKRTAVRRRKAPT